MTQTFSVNIVNDYKNMECDKESNTILNGRPSTKHQNVNQLRTESTGCLHNTNEWRNWVIGKLIHMICEILEQGNTLFNILYQFHVQE